MPYNQDFVSTLGGDHAMTSVPKGQSDSLPNGSIQSPQRRTINYHCQDTSSRLKSIPCRM